MPVVSVIVPAFDRAGTIGAALDSIIGQEPAPAEVLVIDDASTDDTVAAVQRRSDTLVRVLRHDRRKGACAARNTGIEAATGEVIAFCDADDRWLPGWLASQLDVLEDGAAGSVTGLIAHRGTRRRRSGPWGFGTDPMAAILRDRHGGFSTSGIAVWQQAVGPFVRFDESFPSLQDLDFLLQLSEAGTVVANPDAWVSKSADSANRVYGGRRIVLGRRALIDKWGPQMRLVGAYDLQLRLLVEAAASFGDEEDYADAVRLFSEVQQSRALANVAMKHAIGAGRAQAATTGRWLRRVHHVSLRTTSERARDLARDLMHSRLRSSSYGRPEPDSGR
ncbi:MAG: glycosyltransferase family 2 protein [Acidimicrobiales bacterium]